MVLAHGRRTHYLMVPILRRGRLFRTQRKESRDRVYIRDFEALSQFCERAAHSRVVAVDTEFIRERTYYPKLCLVQVATADEAVAIDPLLIDDLTPLRKIMLDSRVTKVFHACTQDLEVLLNAFGAVPAPVFDTQLAAAFLGQRQQLGYGALVEAYCGVRLAKAESLTDWARRPLDVEQLRYAEDDVRYLPGIYDQMLEQLSRLDRLSWLGPEMDALTDAARVQRDPNEAYLHLKRSSSLTRRQLAVAREACAWRERTAARRNIPRKWVVTDEVLVESCRRVPRTVEALRRIRGTESLGERDALALVEAIERGADSDPATYPQVQHRDRPSAEMESVLDLMYAMLRIVSDKSGIAPQLIASRDDLHDLALGRPKARLARGWRHELAGRSLQRLLAGEVGLTVKEGRVETL